MVCAAPFAAPDTAAGVATVTGVTGAAEPPPVAAAGCAAAGIALSAATRPPNIVTREASAVFITDGAGVVIEGGIEDGNDPVPIGPPAAEGYATVELLLLLLLLLLLPPLAPATPIAPAMAPPAALGSDVVAEGAGPAP